jgi:hypothetical protein
VIRAARFSAFVLLTAALAAAGATVAGAGSSTSRAGSDAHGVWSATLRYQTGADRLFPRVSHLRLRVTRSGVVVYNRAVPLPRDCVAEGCSLLDGPGGQALTLRDLGLPMGLVAVIWFWTGGAHCCTVVRALSIPDGHGATKNFGDPGARIVTLDGKHVFRSADDRFAYLFTSFAASGFPVQVWRFAGRRFVDVTREFPAAIQTDAAIWWKVVVRERASGGEVRGAFAAWAADSCALGRGGAVAQELAAGVSAGIFSPPKGEPGGPAGAQYATALQARLRRWGYCR